MAMLVCIKQPMVLLEVDGWKKTCHPLIKVMYEDPVSLRCYQLLDAGGKADNGSTNSSPKKSKFRVGINCKTCGEEGHSAVQCSTILGEN